METKCDVLVVGAGLSGLSAARELRKRAPDLKITVIDAKDRTGGRTLTMSLKTANGTDQFDLGGQWVGPTQVHILNLMKELNVDHYPQYVDGTKFSLIGGTKIRPYNTTLPSATELKNYGIWEGIDFLLSFARMEREAKKLNPRDLFANEDACILDEQSVADWARKSCYTQTMMDCVDVASQATLGMPSKRISALFFLYYGRCCGRMTDLFEAEGNGAQAMRIKGGAQQLSRMMADDLGDSCVRLNTAVISIESVDGGLRVLTESTDGKATQVYIRCNRLILAIPPCEMGKIRFSPALPGIKRQLFDCAPPGHLFKFLVTYKRAFWREHKQSGEIVSTGRSDIPGEIRPILLTYDATTNNGNAALVGFIHSEYWTTKSRNERRSAVINDLVAFFGDDARHVVDYEEKDWQTESFVGGCPVACLPTGNMDAMSRIREPIDRIHIAGTESATLWPGYMSGAVQAGLRAANEILWNMRPICVDKSLLDGSIYADDYRAPVCSRIYSTKTTMSWAKRILIMITIAIGVYAIGKQCNITYIDQLFSPIESIICDWYHYLFR